MDKCLHFSQQNVSSIDEWVRFAPQKSLPYVPTPYNRDGNHQSNLETLEDSRVANSLSPRLYVQVSSHQADHVNRAVLWTTNRLLLFLSSYKSGGQVYYSSLYHSNIVADCIITTEKIGCNFVKMVQNQK